MEKQSDFVSRHSVVFHCPPGIQPLIQCWPYSLISFLSPCFILQNSLQIKKHKTTLSTSDSLIKYSQNIGYSLYFSHP